MSHLNSPRSKAYALLLINTALWGFAAPILKYSLNYISPHQFLLGRYLIATLVFFPIYAIYLKKPKTQNLSPFSLILLALLGTPLSLIPLYFGLQMTTSIEASILIATGPLITIIGGWLLLKEKVSSKEKLGILLALIGTAIIVLKPILASSSPQFNGSSSLLGNCLIIFSNFVWASFLLLNKKKQTNPAQISMVSYTISVPIFLVLSLIETPSFYSLQTSILNINALPGILYMALFGSIIAFWAYTAAQRKIEASEAAVFTYLQPLFALPLALFWLKESLSLPLIIGCFIIALGVYTSEKR